MSSGRKTILGALSAVLLIATAWVLWVVLLDHEHPRLDNRQASQAPGSANSPKGGGNQSQPDPAPDTVAAAGRVRVVDDAGNAVPGALVAAMHAGIESEPVRADKAGYANTDPDWQALQISAPGHVPRRVEHEAGPRPRNIELARTASATVTLKGPQGLPSAFTRGRALRLLPSARWPRPDWGLPQGHPTSDGTDHLFRTDNDGTTRLDNLVPGQEYTVVADLDNVVVDARCVFRLEPGEHRAVTISLPAGLWVYGSVLDAHGTAVNEATVTVVHHTLSDRGHMEVRREVGRGFTNPRGEFLVKVDTTSVPAHELESTIPLYVVAESHPEVGRCDMTQTALAASAAGVFRADTMRFGGGCTLAGWARTGTEVLPSFPLAFSYELWTVRLQTDAAGYFRVTGLPMEAAKGLIRIRVKHYDTGYYPYGHPGDSTLKADALDGPPVNLEFTRITKTRIRLKVSGAGPDSRPDLYYASDTDRSVSAHLSLDVPEAGLELKGQKLLLFVIQEELASPLTSIDASGSAGELEVSVKLEPGFRLVVEKLPPEHGIQYLWVEDASGCKLTTDWFEDAEAGQSRAWVLPTGAELFLVAQMAESGKLRRVSLGVGTGGTTREISLREIQAADPD